MTWTWMWSLPNFNFCHGSQTVWGNINASITTVGRATDPHEWLTFSRSQIRLFQTKFEDFLESATFEFCDKSLILNTDQVRSMIRSTVVMINENKKEYFAGGQVITNHHEKELEMKDHDHYEVWIVKHLIKLLFDIRLSVRLSNFEIIANTLLFSPWSTTLFR